LETPSAAPLITIAVPSYNQGAFLDDALRSIFDQGLPIEVFIADGGSKDETLSVIKRWEHRLIGWRSGRDRGQAAAINEGISKGTAPFVAWLNSDDVYLPGGLKSLMAALQKHPAAPAAYGQVWNTDRHLGKLKRIRTEPFRRARLAARCIVSQPGTLMRREAWEAVGGANENLSMSMDYDLWWKLSEKFGDFIYIPTDVAINRDHEDTKTNTRRRQHYTESMSLVKKYYGRIPMRWFVAWPISVGLRSLLNRRKKAQGAFK
jgi:glycosyltransferase involved in cell wall biosynthesis